MIPRKTQAYFNQYIGIPYLSRGDSFRGADCFGLLKLIYLHELGIEFPEYEYTDAKDIEGNAPIIQREKSKWKKIPNLEICSFDVVSFRIAGVEAHLGVVIDSTEKLAVHTLANHDSALIRLDSAQWEKRIAGFYRHYDFLQTPLL